MSLPLFGSISPAAVADWNKVLLQLDLKGGTGYKYDRCHFAFPFCGPLDTAGTLVGIGTKSAFLDKGKATCPEPAGLLLADAIGTVGGAVLGTSTVTTYVESAAGVAAGGRTG